MSSELIKITQFATAILQRLNEDWDIVIAITGEEGVGKSTFAILLAMAIDKAFNLINNVSYLPTYSEIERKFHELAQYQVLVIDEAIKVLYKLKWADKLQIRINEMYATERWQNKCTLLCMPRFTDFNEQFRNHRIKIWIDVIDRGMAVAHAKGKANRYRKDPWYLEDDSKKIDKILKSKKLSLMPTDEIINLQRKSMTFWFIIEFEDLDDETKATYREIKEKMRSVKEDYDPKIKQLIEARNSFILFVYENCYMKGVIENYHEVKKESVTEDMEIYIREKKEYKKLERVDLESAKRVFRKTTEEGYKKITEKEVCRIFNMTQSAVSQIIKQQREKKAMSVFA